MTANPTVASKIVEETLNRMIVYGKRLTVLENVLKDRGSDECSEIRRIVDAISEENIRATRQLQYNEQEECDDRLQNVWRTIAMKLLYEPILQDQNKERNLSKLWSNDTDRMVASLNKHNADSFPGEPEKFLASSAYPDFIIKHLFDIHELARSYEKALKKTSDTPPVSARLKDLLGWLDRRFDEVKIDELKDKEYRILRHESFRLEMHEKGDVSSAKLILVYCPSSAKSECLVILRKGKNQQMEPARKIDVEHEHAGTFRVIGFRMQQKLTAPKIDSYIFWLQDLDEVKSVIKENLIGRF